MVRARRSIAPATVLLAFLLVAAGAVAAVAAGLALAACGGEPEGEGFAIYLLDPQIPPQDLATASHVEIAAEPLVATADIVSYDRATHEIELTAAAYERLFGTGAVAPLLGRTFAVCVDRQPVYTGAVWTMFSSQSFDGVVIMQLWDADAAPERHAMRLELGYPGPDFFTGEDPRSDPAVIDALERAGRLR